MEKLNVKLRTNLLGVQKIVLPTIKNRYLNQSESEKTLLYTSSFLAELNAFGYVLSEKAVNHIKRLTPLDIITLYNEWIPAAKKSVGAVRHKPMYNNFPQEVMAKQRSELYFNALVHYWSDGRFLPLSEALPRAINFEQSNMTTLDMISEDTYYKFIGDLLSSKDSLPESMLELIDKNIDNSPYDIISLTLEAQEKKKEFIIPQKELAARITGTIIKKEYFDLSSKLRNVGVIRDFLASNLKTATDILRCVTFMSGGDTTLASNTKFKSMPRKTRRCILNLLEQVITGEDVKRHKNKWNKLFHSLHHREGNYKNIESVASRIRSNKNIRTVQTDIAEAIKYGDIRTAVKGLISRPGEFARSLDKLLRLADVYEKVDGSNSVTDFVLKEFKKVGDSVSTKVLLQLLGFYGTRDEGKPRIVFPVGQSYPTKLPAHEPLQSHGLTIKTYMIITNLLTAQYAEKFKDEDFGKVYIDPELINVPVPFGMREAAPGKIVYPKGTKLPLGISTSGTLRFFIYWIGQDIDLSMKLYDSGFREIADISYYNLTDELYGFYHSGDITRAPKGASEFIDVDLNKCRKNGVRYIASSVNVYAGPSFGEHKEAFFGWMERTSPRSNEIYEPKTVINKVDLVSSSMMTIPVLFDLVEMRAIWADANVNINAGVPNNVYTNRVTIKDTLESIVGLSSKADLYNIFGMATRGSKNVEYVVDPMDADTVFSLYPVADLDEKVVQITASDYVAIQSKWM